MDILKNVNTHICFSFIIYCFRATIIQNWHCWLNHFSRNFMDSGPYLPHIFPPTFLFCILNSFPCKRSALLIINSICLNRVFIQACVLFLSALSQSLFHHGTSFCEGLSLKPHSRSFQLRNHCVHPLFKYYWLPLSLLQYLPQLVPFSSDIIKSYDSVPRVYN